MQSSVQWHCAGAGSLSDACAVRVNGTRRRVTRDQTAISVRFCVSKSITAQVADTRHVAQFVLLDKFKDRTGFLCEKDKMPRIYKCRKCGQQHGPPTGKQCTNDRDLGTDNPVQDLLPVLMEIKSNMGSMEEYMANRIGSMEERMASMESRDRAESEQGEQEQDSDGSDEGETVADEEGATGGSDITPKMLRKDIRAMRKAAGRLAKFQDTDSEDEDYTVLHTTKRNVKSPAMQMGQRCDVGYVGDDDAGLIGFRMGKCVL